jgi:hypothetical protein
MLRELVVVCLAPVYLVVITLVSIQDRLTAYRARKQHLV